MPGLWKQLGYKGETVEIQSWNDSGDDIGAGTLRAKTPEGINAELQSSKEALGSIPSSCHLIILLQGRVEKIWEGN